MSAVMENVDDIVTLTFEAKELERQIAAIERRIGSLGSPDRADIGGAPRQVFVPAMLGVHGGLTAFSSTLSSLDG
jgi:hypothetical protein